LDRPYIEISSPLINKIEVVSAKKCTRTLLLRTISGNDVVILSAAVADLHSCKHRSKKDKEGVREITLLSFLNRQKTLLQNWATAKDENTIHIGFALGDRQ
jgi:hypothetical protein